MIRNQRGDTLVEITVALAILGVVLVSAYVLSTRGYQLGQTSKERSELVLAAQAQAEALISYRDNVSWNTFTYGDTSYPGISVRDGSGNCETNGSAQKKCFHMEKKTINGTVVWVPVMGVLNASDAGMPPGYSVWIYAPQSSGAAMYDFQIVYEAPAVNGKYKNRAAIYLKLTNLDAL